VLADLEVFLIKVEILKVIIGISTEHAIYH
jgi:hypothetical protein